MDFYPTVKVLNLAYEKTVWVDYTLDEWKSSARTYLTWQYSLDSGHDVFNGMIPRVCLPNEDPDSPYCDGVVGQYRIGYTVSGQTYWDTNSGRDYPISGERAQTR